MLNARSDQFHNIHSNGFYFKKKKAVCSLLILIPSLAERHIHLGLSGSKKERAYISLENRE